MCYLTVLEARSPPWRACRVTSFWGSEEVCSVTLLGSGDRWHSLVLLVLSLYHSSLCPYLHVVSFVCLWVKISSFYKDTSHIGFRASLTPNGASQVAQWSRIRWQCRRCGFDPWVRKLSWSFSWSILATPVLLPRESHGHRTLAGYSPWGCKESNVT